VVEPPEDLLDELAPPRALTPGYRTVAILSGGGATLHLTPRLPKDGTNLLGVNRSPKAAELGGVDLGRARVTIQEGVSCIKCHGCESVPRACHGRRITFKRYNVQRSNVPRGICHTQPVVTLFRYFFPDSGKQPSMARCLSVFWLTAIVVSVAAPVGAGAVEDRVNGHIEAAVDGGVRPADYHHLFMAFAWRGTLSDWTDAERNLDRLSGVRRVDPDDPGSVES